MENVVGSTLRGRAAQIIILLCFGTVAITCVAQDQDVLCSAGNGSFQARFQSTGVTVQVGASRNGELATRNCEAVLTWKKHTLPIATSASQIDIDEFGADVGLGEPVVAFQVKKLERDCCREYQIYLLRAPPHLLQTITGGESFRAADTDLDGRVEIWTDDAAAVDGVESLSLGNWLRRQSCFAFHVANCWMLVVNFSPTLIAKSKS
jgi:hypothetical protein